MIYVYTICLSSLIYIVGIASSYLDWLCFKTKYRRILLGHISCSIMGVTSFVQHVEISHVFEIFIHQTISSCQLRIDRDIRIRNNMDPRKKYHWIRQFQRIKVELINFKVEKVRMKMLTCQVMEILINQLRGIKTNSILCPQYLIE